MVESNKEVKVSNVLCFGCFLTKVGCWTRLFQFTWFLLSTGTSQLPQEWRSTKVIWFASSPISPSQKTVKRAAATKILWCSVQQLKRQSTIPTGGLGSLPVAHPVSPRQALMNAIQHQHKYKAHWLHPLWHRALCQAPRSDSDYAECRGVRSLCWILRNGEQMGTIR